MSAPYTEETLNDMTNEIDFNALEEELERLGANLSNSDDEMSIESPGIPLTIEAQQSTLETSLYEKVDIDDLNCAIKYTEENDVSYDNSNFKYSVVSSYGTLNAHLKAYKKLHKNGKVKVEFVKPQSGYGRVYPKHRLGMLSFKRDVRNALLYKNYIDFDLCNAGPEIIRNICHANDIACPTVDHYCDNRENVLESICGFYGCSREEAKELFIRLCNFGQFRTWAKDYKLDDELMPFIENFIEELKNIAKIVQKHNPKLNKIIEKQQEKQKQNGTRQRSNLLGGMFAIFIQEYELRVIDLVYTKINKTCLTKGSMIYESDGIKLLKSNVKKFGGLEKTLEHMNDILCEAGWETLCFKDKPIETDVDLSMYLPEVVLEREEYEVAEPTTTAEPAFDNDEQQIYDYDDSTVAKVILDNIGENFAMSNGLLYVYTNNEWKQNMKIASAYVSQFVEKYFTKLIIQANMGSSPQTKAKADERDSHIKTLVSCRQKGANTKSLGLLMSFLVMKLEERDADKNIEFDVSNPYVFRFNNIAIDVRTGKEYKVKREDYLTFRSGFDYEEPTTEAMQMVNQMFEQIFQDVQTRKTYLSVLRSALTGIRPEKFFMANGCGRNGKGAINELMKSLMGKHYSYKGNITTLTVGFKAGPNPELANLDKKRFVVFSEPNGNDTLKLGNIRQITGDDDVNARMLHSNDTNLTLFNTIVFECNKKPTIDDTIDNSIISRFVNIKFPSIFYNPDENPEYADLPNAHIMNKRLKERDFKEEHRCALFKYIINNAPKDIYISKAIIAETREYLIGNDEFHNWFDDKYIADPNKIIRVRDLFTLFKNSDYYNDLPRAKKRAMTEKRFKNETICENIQVKNYFREKIKITKALIDSNPELNSSLKIGSDMNSVIVGFREKVLEDYENTDE